MSNESTMGIYKCDNSNHPLCRDIARERDASAKKVAELKEEVERLIDEKDTAILAYKDKLQRLTTLDPDN